MDAENLKKCPGVGTRSLTVGRRGNTWGQHEIVMGSDDMCCFLGRLCNHRIGHEIMGGVTRI